MKEFASVDDTLLELSNIAVSLSANRHLPSLQTDIIDSVKRIFGSDGASFYVLEADKDLLHFQVISNDRLNIHEGGTWSEVKIPPLSMYNDNGSPNMSNMAVASLHEMRVINIEDVYQDTEFDLLGVLAFDQQHDYHTLSILTVPMQKPDGSALGVLQIVNPRDKDDNLAGFDNSQLLLARAIASQISVVYSNHKMVDEQEKFWEALLALTVRAIDEKSAYTSGHCRRVPVLAEEIALSINEGLEGKYGNSFLNDEDLYELNIAALLHDIGKLSTPEYVVDKATKLEGVYNRIHAIRVRFEVLWRDARIKELEACQEGADAKKAEQERLETQKRLQNEFFRLAKINIGSEALSDDDKDFLEKISEYSFIAHFPQDAGVSATERQHFEKINYSFSENEKFLLIDKKPDAMPYSDSEFANLNIFRGTLNGVERGKIEDHALAGIRLIQELPFPVNLKEVVSIAGAHHEKLNGTGYPFGLRANDLSLRARILAVADIFEALTASDRPYKSAKKLTQCLQIMAFMAKDKDIDADIFRTFLLSKRWLGYAQKFLRPDQIDEVDIDSILVMLSA